MSANTELIQHNLDKPVRGSELSEYYRKMYLIRQTELAILELRNTDKIAGSVHLCVGQESAPVGVVAALSDVDKTMATYRGHGWALASGLPLRSLFSEVLGRANGINGGRAGSPYFVAPEVGFIGENSIVAAGLPIANGIAMGLRDKGNSGVVAISFGDGATNQGAGHEAMVFAIARKLPVIFVCENNTWSEMTPISETVPNAELWKRAAGYGMHAELVNGEDLLAIYAAATKAVERARKGEGPSFLEITVPRILGHYNADIEQYRSAEDKAHHLSRDPLAKLRALLCENGEEKVKIIENEVDSFVAAEREFALASAFPEPEDAIGHVFASNTWSSVSAFPTSGEEIAYGLAVNKALHEEMESRPEVVLFGEDIATAGGTFGVTRNLMKKYGGRIFDTPISEAAILGAAIGSSIQGMKPIVEIMWTDFLLVAFDQIVNQAANVRYVSKGKQSAPMVVRMQQGVTPGSCAQHTQSLEALIAHIPGIKVGLPSNAHDAYQMLRAAVADPDPVIVIESRALYLSKGFLDINAPREQVGGARIRKTGKDLAIVSWGKNVPMVLEAAEQLEKEGISASVLDLRWLNPLDEASIVEIVKNSSGKLLVVHEANITGGFGAEISARISEKHLEILDAPVKRLATPDSRIPSSPILQGGLIPDVKKIFEAAQALYQF
ncbi:MAG: thiamine pyrophosphate-dependent enzyme [Actinobacteria bacterium]|nr:thiamine pyrophosphate-dependent enzyme [Actinomycetota bacterium]